MVRMPSSLRGQSDRQGDHDRRRRQAKPSRRWYSTGAWQARRADQLAREPNCRMHWEREGAIVPAKVADHVVPHRENPTLFWHGDLQSLCTACHSSVKQREERRGVGQSLAR